jgi:hypothetical protein
MKHLLLAAAFAFAMTGPSLSQGTGTSDREGGNAKPSTASGGPDSSPGTPGMKASSGAPCAAGGSGTSDREGGGAKPSTASGGPNSNLSATPCKTGR